jgi:hypothetical protein
MKRQRASNWVVLALVGAGVILETTPARAAPDAAVAVLGIEASEGAPDSLAGALSDALRQRVSGTKGFRLVPGRDLVEVKLVFSCPDEAPSCMASAGKSLGATKLIFGSVKRSAGEYYVVTLKLLDTNRSIVDAWVAEQITKAQAAGPALKGPVQKWFATLTGQGGAGTVRIRGDVIGAAVALDGTPSGLIGTDDLVLTGVTPGKHELVVTKPGYEAVRKDVVVAAGDTAHLDVSLPRVAGGPAAVNIPSSGNTAAGQVDESRTLDRESSASGAGLKTATWAVLGAGVVGIALGVKWGIDVQAVNNKLDPYRRFPCTTSPNSLCNSNLMPAPMLTAAEQKYVQDEKDDGRRLETYQYIAYGVGGALVLAGGYLLYRAYLDEDSEPRASTRSRVAVAPIMAPGVLGVTAAAHF